MSSARLTNTFLGHYHLMERLGAGGMATVYKAQDTRLKRTIAIKVLHDHLVYEESFRERFIQEARFIASFNHPHIIQIFDFDGITQDGHSIYYMAMPFIPGKTLAEVIETARHEDKLLPLERVQHIMADLTAALNYAHDRGMIHRDVKPGNILFDEHDRAILTDFGIARLAQQSGLTQEGLIVGTPAYMSPEQATGMPVDARADLYALGIIFYELLTGRQPFDDDGTVSILLKHVQAPIPKPSDFRHLPNPDFDAIVCRALAKDPHERYQTADEFAKDIQTVFSGKHLVPPPAVVSATRQLPPLTAEIKHLTTAEKPKNRQTTLVTTIAEVVIHPARQNPLAFLALILAAVALLVVARMTQVPTAAAPAPTAMANSMTDSMTGDFYFESTFSNRDIFNINWEQNPNGDITRSIENGYYVLTNRISSTAMTALFSPDYRYTNVHLAMAVRLNPESAAASGYGLVFRYQDADNYNVFAIDGRGRYSIWVRENGVWRELRGLTETWTQHPMIKPIGEDNLIEVNIFNNKIVGFVNGEEIISLEETTFANGNIGVYMASTSQGIAQIQVEAYEARTGLPMAQSMTADAVDSMTGDEGTP
jgi:serine/threonine protein kinase